MKREEISGLLRAGRQDHWGGEAIHAQSRDVDLTTAVGGKLEGEFGRRTRGDGTEGTPEVDGGGQRTGCQQNRSQGMGGDDGRSKRVGG